jgi:hypothetical protein
MSNDLDRLLASHHALAIKKKMDVRREEYLDFMTFRSNARPLFDEIFGPIIGLKEEWIAQGATPAELDMSAFRFRRPSWRPLPVSTGWIEGKAVRIIEETAEHVIARDQMGRRVKLCRGVASIPLPLDYPVKTTDDWRKVKFQYEFHAKRVASDFAREAREAREAGQVVRLSIPGGFDEPRQLLGEEGVCVAAGDEPELLHEILGTIAETAVRVIREVQARGGGFDELYVHEDMAGKSGPLFGPRQVREFMAPYFRRAWAAAQEAGARVFMMDSDGDMSPILADLCDAGMNAIHPMEPVGNNGLLAVREKLGKRLAFQGGIDKHALRKGHAAIEAELEAKVPAMVRSGGCIFALDHRIPNGTPLEAYRFYHAKMWEILEREAGAG